MARVCGIIEEDLEMLVAAKAQGFDRIYEAPIKLNYLFASVTTARSMNSIRGMLVDTAAIWYRRYLVKYYTAKTVK